MEKEKEGEQKKGENRKKETKKQKKQMDESSDVLNGVVVRRVELLWETLLSPTSKHPRGLRTPPAAASIIGE